MVIDGNLEKLLKEEKAKEENMKLYSSLFIQIWHGLQELKSKEYYLNNLVPADISLKGDDLNSLEAKIRCFNCSNEESKVSKKDSYHLAAIFYEIVTGSRL